MHDPHVLVARIARPPITPAEWRRALRLGDGHKRSGWLRLPTFAEVWHREPDGRDAFEVCPHAGRWQWHVHHWRVKVIPYGHLRRWLFRRCDLCGRRHGWSKPGFGVGGKTYHFECSEAVTLRADMLVMTEAMSRLFAAWGIDSREDLRSLVDNPFERRDQFLLSYQPWTRVERYRERSDAERWRAPNEHIRGR